MELEGCVREITANGAVARDFEFCHQIRKSSGAPAAHIAEGFGRFTPREFARYLRIALSSLKETQTHLERGLNNRHFDKETYANASRLCGRATKITTRLLVSKLRQIAAEEQGKKEQQDRKRRAE
jgi:four helix bundle protein